MCFIGEGADLSVCLSVHSSFFQFFFKFISTT